MHRKRKSQLSITMIITAIIGLIILVVIVLMLTGKLGAFGEGTSRASGCETICKTIGMDDLIITDQTETWCKGATMSGKKYKYMPGTYSDVDEDKVCCCRGNV